MVVAVRWGERRRHPRGHHGQSLVELALFGPLLFMLVLGAGDVGRVFYYSVALQNAAREGARHGAYFDPVGVAPSYKPGNSFANNSSILSTVQNEAAYLGIGNLSEPEPPPTKGACPGSAAPYAPPYPASLYPAGNPSQGNGYVYICFNNADANTTATPGQPIRVSVLFTFNPMTPLIWNFLGDGYFRIAGSAEFITEGP